VKGFLAPSLVVAAAVLSLPPVARTETRTIANTRALASEQLQSEMKPKLYKKLSTLPIEGWIIVRGRVTTTRFTGAEVVQSDLNGAYDSLALKVANEAQFSGNFLTESRVNSRQVSLHVLIYPAGDAKMVLCFVHVEQMRYRASPRMFLLKAGKLKSLYL
jgi:hypothetical protein